MTKKLLPLFLILTFFGMTAYANHLSSHLMFTARLTGDAEVPAVTTDGLGLGVFSFDEKKSTLYVNVSLSNLSGPITGMHIHEGAVGVNGGVVFNLTPFLNGNRAKGKFENVSRESFAKFITGEYYINVHTEANPDGEIRGQIYLETDEMYVARLSGAEENPPVATDGQGLFVARLSGSRVSFHMVFMGLSGPPVSAHIHEGAPGENGAPILTLTDSIRGNVISGTWSPGDFLSALRAGNLYVNVHTDQHAGGEIRGQIVLEEGLNFDLVLDGEQEFPPVETSANGIGIVNISPDLSTIKYYVLFDSLSGPAMGAHFHLAPAGANGGVRIDITDNILENTIAGEQPISIELVNALLAGGMYINVHTDEHGSGEIRGQVYKMAREPYVYDINGGQEVPPTNSTGTGTGIVTIDRDNTNAHFMLVYSGLQGNFTISHFHNAPPAENGGVLFDLTPFYNGTTGAFGYWEGADFSADDALAFRNHDVYANIHSSLFGGGEIRGNVVRSSKFFVDPPFDPGFGNDFILVAELFGDNEEPPVTTDGVGLATVYFNEDRTSAFVNVTVRDLSGPVISAHIHAGQPGENGGVVFPLTPVGNRIHEELTGITPEQLAGFISGGYYINVHTDANQGGEIRGQILIDQDFTFVATMEGGNENPPVTTDAKGLGAFHYTWGSQSIDVNVQLKDLSSPIVGAHLHGAPPGENGSVLVNLGDLIDGNTIRGVVDMNLADLDDLFQGNVYINIHTENNPDGEIRGQLVAQSGLSFDGWMNGVQEVPFATTPASGLSIVNLTNDLDSAHVWVVTDDMSGPATIAHLHNAPVGSSAGVVLDLSAGISDNNITFSGPITNPAVVPGLLSGTVYTNMHTAAFPGGELRGQNFRLARDGYGFDLCPEQEVGSVNAPFATGSALVSIDRLHTNLNISTVLDGLTGDLTAAHIHEAPIGMNGGVIYPLPEILSGSGFGFGIPVADSIITAILEGNAYINGHTNQHPAGEVRGQIVKEALCSIQVGINDIDGITGEVSLTPIPVNDFLNVSVTTERSTTLYMNIMDGSGKLLSTDKYSLQEGKNIVQLETESLYPGFYILMISDGNAAQTYKFVK